MTTKNHEAHDGEQRRIIKCDALLRINILTSIGIGSVSFVDCIDPAFYQILLIRRFRIREAKMRKDFSGLIAFNKLKESSSEFVFSSV